MRYEKVLVVVLKWSLERRIGWEFWRLWRAVWKDEISGGLERRTARTVVPVPVGTALHQLYSVPPTGRSSGARGSPDMLVREGERERRRSHIVRKSITISSLLSVKPTNFPRVYVLRWNIP